MNDHAQHHLRRDAEHLAGPLPALFISAERLASTVWQGVHGRRQTGPGENFRQYRQALPGDESATIDWRRSGRSDSLYIREHEREVAHTALIWVDDALSMDYRSKGATQSKRERAALLALALSILLNKAGERVAFPATSAAEPRLGERHLQRIMQALTLPRTGRPEYGVAPDVGGLQPAHTVLFSDFLGPDAEVFTAIEAMQSGGAGYLVQILDEAEEVFPFDGSIVFETMTGEPAFETRRASALQADYRARLAERCSALEDAALKGGWRYLKHHTGESAQTALLALYTGMGLQG